MAPAISDGSAEAGDVDLADLARVLTACAAATMPTVVGAMIASRSG